MLRKRKTRRQYSKLLDLMILASSSQRKGKHREAANYLTQAAELSDFDTEVDYLDSSNQNTNSPVNNDGEYATWDEGEDTDAFSGDFSSDDSFQDIADEESEETSLARALASLNLNKANGGGYRRRSKLRGYNIYSGTAGDVDTFNSDVDAFENSGDSDFHSFNGFELSDSDNSGNETYVDQLASKRQTKRHERVKNNLKHVR